MVMMDTPIPRLRNRNDRNRGDSSATTDLSIISVTYGEYNSHCDGGYKFDRRCNHLSPRHPPTKNMQSETVQTQAISAAPQS